MPGPIRPSTAASTDTDSDLEDGPTRFDRATDSLLDINRASCKIHADFKRSFISNSILKVKYAISALQFQAFM